LYAVLMTLPPQHVPGDQASTVSWYAVGAE
jgi:hypothetical protein